ncbi:MAG: efflux RND transporter periplasmic adaptor subunit [Planctomycetota bacterium]
MIRSALALIALGAGAGALAWLVATRPAPPANAEPPRLPSVAVAQLSPRVFDAPVVGYGTVRPKNQVKIIPQVSGAITDMHPDLAVGKVIRDDAVLFEIDRRAYDSQVLQVKADIKLLETQLERHQREQQNLTERLANARQLLDLAGSDLKRNQDLVDDGAGAPIDVDAARERFLQRKDVVIAYENQLKLIPHLQAETNARLEARRAQLADAERNVEYTTIRCPFDARVDGVTAKTSQVVIANLAIATLTDMEAFEIAAVLDPSDLQWSDRRAYARAMGSDVGQPPSVTVTWTLLGRRYSWTGQVSRLERHDEATRTARLVVEIPNSLDEVASERSFGKPQLNIGMFCAAEIPAEPLQDALVVPRSAIYEDNTVYVFEPDPSSPDGLTGQLAARTVPMLRSVDDEVLVDFSGRGEDERLRTAQALARCELRPGEFVVVSPLPRPVVGMKLRRRTDLARGPELDQNLFAQAVLVPQTDLVLLPHGHHSLALPPDLALRTVILGAR